MINGDSGCILLSELLDIPALEDVFDSFRKLTGLPTAVLDLEGHILIASGWQRICTDFHRKHPDTAARCLESDTVLANQLKAGRPFNIYQCQNGLIDVATPIIIENIHLGNLFAGQFLFENPDIPAFTRQADAYGFDREPYLDALAEVPVLSRDEVMTAMEFLTRLTVVIASAGIDRKQLIEWNQNLEKEVEERTVDVQREKTFSESLISSLPGVMYVFDRSGRFTNWNRNFERITGYTRPQILDMTPLDFIAAEDRPRVLDVIEQVFQEGQASVEAGFATASGKIIPFLFTGYRFEQESNDYLIGVGLDISERVKTENEKSELIAQLQQTLSEIKVLSGLLPICASCKKIRDDQGYWNQIESYIHAHSEAEFSHSMCPECLKRYYGNEPFFED